MPIYKLKNRKGYYFAFYFNKKKYKKETYNGKHMLSKAEALQCEYEFKKQLEDEYQREIGNLSLYELYDEFVKHTKSTMKISTQDNYNSFKKVYLVLAENKNIYDLTPNDILKWKNKISKIDVSVAYKNRMISIIKKMLEFGTVMYNLQGKLQMPILDNFKETKILNTDKRSKYITQDDFRLLMSMLDLRNTSHYYYYVIFNMLYYCGLRIGELAALTINDLKGNRLIINKDYIRVAGVDYIQPPKNKNSIREVVVDDNTLKLLNDYIDRFKPTNILFRQEAKFLCQQKTRDMLTKISKASGLDSKYIITPHTLRHSHSSHLRKLGFDEIAIAERLGNTPQIASKIYTHTDSNEKFEIAEKLTKNQ